MNVPLSAPRRIGIVGTGAIGGFLAARLALAGHTVSVLARGATLEALSTHGLRFTDNAQQSHVIPVRACASTSEMGAQELVIVALKSQALPGLAAQLAPLISTDTTILPVGNGLPWWYFFVDGKPLAGLRLTSVDPDGSVERALPLGQVLGGCVIGSCSCPEPGVVVNKSGGSVVMGEPAGGNSTRSAEWADVLTAAGVPTRDSDDIRRDIWLKLLGNICANPLSLITGARTDELLEDPSISDIFRQIMEECLQLGRHIGLTLDIDPLQRMNQTRQLGAVKTSMLQDLEAGKSVELDAIIGAPLECAAQAGLGLPRMEMVFALARMRARQVGLYPA
jgi:2-dehydropantoate 2-reductase